MKGIVYTGSSDTQIYGPGDLAKVGVEDFEETQFHQGVAVEVHNKVADAIVGNESGLFAAFEYSDVEEVEQPVAEPEPEPSIYAEREYNELKKDISARNEEREDDAKIHPASQSKDDLIAALDADDANVTP